MDRSMRFLVLEWIRADPISRAPLFIEFFRSEYHCERFRGYADTVARMYVLSTGCIPLVIPPALEERARILNEQAEIEIAKLEKLQEAMAHQEMVVNELCSPWHSLDSDVMRLKPLSLPKRAAVVHPPRIIPRAGRWKNKGKDLSAIVADHRDVLTSDLVAASKPWSSRKRSADQGQGASREDPYFASGLLPTLRPIRMREQDEREHVGHARSRKRAKSVVWENGVPVVEVLQPNTSGPAPTQDEFEEFKAEFEDDCMLNWNC